MNELQAAIEAAGLPYNPSKTNADWNSPIAWRKGMKEARIERTGIRVDILPAKGGERPSDPADCVEVKLYSVFFRAPNDKPCHRLTAAEACAHVRRWMDEQ